MSAELCPICIDNDAKYFTECNHGYCITCLCRIKNCALCRKTLLRSEMCKLIKSQKKLIQQPLQQQPLQQQQPLLERVYRIFDNSIYGFALRPEDHQPSGTGGPSRIDTYSFALRPEDHQPRGFAILPY